MRLAMGQMFFWWKKIKKILIQKKKGGERDMIDIYKIDI